MTEDSSRVERVLALLLVNQMRTQREKILQLNLAGFTNTDIADLLETSSGVVSQVLYATRRGLKHRKPVSKKVRR